MYLQDILKLESVRFLFLYLICSWAMPHLCFPTLDVHGRTWNIEVFFFFLFLPLISSGKSQPALLLPTPVSAGSPALSFQHHFDTDESPIFTRISHFPYVCRLSPFSACFSNTQFWCQSHPLENWASYLSFQFSPSCHCCWQHHYLSRFSRFQISWPIQLSSPSPDHSSDCHCTSLWSLQCAPCPLQSFL